MKQSKNKCYVCGREFKNVYVRKGCYESLTVASKSNFHMCGRFQWGRSHWTLLLSQESEYPTKRANARPICLECFITKLNQAILALKNEDEGQKPAEGESQEAPNTAAPAPEVKKEEPFDYDKLTYKEQRLLYYRLLNQKWGEEPTELELHQGRIWTDKEIKQRKYKGLPL